MEVARETPEEKDVRKEKWSEMHETRLAPGPTHSRSDWVKSIKEA